MRCSAQIVEQRETNMKLVIQRVKEASVKVDKKIVGKINKGFMVLIGVSNTDTKEIADKALDLLEVDKEGLDLVVDNGYVCAQGTTLGADVKFRAVFPTLSISTKISFNAFFASIKDLIFICFCACIFLLYALSFLLLFF